MMNEFNGLNAALAEVTEAERAAAEARVADFAAYSEHLARWGEPTAWRFPFGGTLPYKALANAHRVDLGKPVSPYTPAQDEWIVFDLMAGVAGTWFTGEQVLGFLRGVKLVHRSQLALGTMLRVNMLGRAGWVVESRKGKPSVEYRLVKKVEAPA